MGNLSRIIRCFVDGESPESARQVYVRKNSTEDDFRQYIEMLFDGKEPVGMRIPNGSDIPLHPSVVYEKTKANDVCMLIYDHVEFGKERSGAYCVCTWLSLFLPGSCKEEVEGVMLTVVRLVSA